MRSNNPRILIIDDEPQIRRALRVSLERAGYQVLLAATGEEGLDIAAERQPELVILDLALPDMEGTEVCRHLREWSKIPIIVLSVRDNDRDKVEALDLGADDYVTKPFSPDELAARIRVALRRQSTEQQPEVASVSVGDLHADFARRIIIAQGKEVHLTPIEYDLLRYLMLNPNRVLTHRQLLSRVWGPEYSEDVATLRVHLANLRNKIEPNPARPQYIHTEPRVGYRFRLPEESGG